MSEKYDEYLNNHINAVNECYRLLTGKELRDCSDMITHDRSKYSKEEYDAYDEFFYPSDGSKVGADPKRREAFDHAWLHHQNHNPHHWQYWTLINDNDGIKALRIPLKYVHEMVADWGAFAYLRKSGQHLLDWYRANCSNQIMHDETRSVVDALVVVLASRIDEHVREVDNG